MTGVGRRLQGSDRPPLLKKHCKSAHKGALTMEKKLCSALMAALEVEKNIMKCPLGCSYMLGNMRNIL